MESRKIIQLFVFGDLAACTSHEDHAQVPAIDQIVPGATKWGYYSGEPVTRWSPDGRNMTLVTELVH